MKINVKYKILLICLLVICLPVISRADEELVFPKYTEEYQRWLELSDEEKANTIEPQPYEIISETVEEAEESEKADENIQVFAESVDTNQLSASVLPSQYIRNDYGSVKNQGNLNACWAYSAATVFDTNYYFTNARRKQFSNLHMDYMTARNYNTNGFNRSYNSGGNFDIALAYATNGMGIALESNMPYSVTASNIKNVKVDSKVSDYIVLSTRNQIKDYIQKYGVVSIATYMGNYQYFSSSNLYNNNDLAYCCTMQEVKNNKISADHAITLIGWNDNYTNSSFPNKKGAFIALNSYGSSFGKNGTYYIFYDDYFVGNTTIDNKVKTLQGVIKTDDIDYDYIYQHDPYGCIGIIGYNDSYGNSIPSYAANVFTRKNQNVVEKLKEISVFVPESGSIKIYINANGNDTNTNSATKTITTFIPQPGYHTIEFSSPIELKNSKFTVGVKYPGKLGVEFPTESGWCSTVTSNKGESYISSNGIDFFDMKNIGYSHVNACIKAFTDKGASLNTNNVPKNEYKTDLVNYVFDYKYYADHNFDLYNAYGYNKTALQNHWNKYGKAEGRASSSVFNVKYYVENNWDIRQAFGNNYTAAYNHFMNYGYAEYRKSSPEYDGIYYKKNNGDLSKMTSMELIRHYSLYGKNELRQASSNYDITDFLFDAEFYAACNPDVANAYGNNSNLLKMHWYKYGIAEGRIASLVFDAKYYLANNKDVAKAYSSKNYLAAYSHFINYGFSEGRQGNQIFSVKYYLSKNIDIKNAYGSNYLKVLNHFIKYGKNEPRITSSKFNVTAYRLKNSDLKRAYGGNYAKYFRHYLAYGKNEKRVCI